MGGTSLDLKAAVTPVKKQKKPLHASTVFGLTSLPAPARRCSRVPACLPALLARGSPLASHFTLQEMVKGGVAEVAVGLVKGLKI